MVTGGASAFTGLLAELGGGVIAWKIFRGPQGVVFATIVGGMTAWSIRRYAKLPASPAAGAIGAMAASYVAIASKILQPGSADWAIMGGAYGATVGVSIGALLGPIALAYRPTAKRSSDGESANSSESPS